MGFTINSPVLAVFILIAGISLMIFSSKKAIDHSIYLASVYKIPSLLIGVVIISLGTDLPEMINSVMSHYLGHADISVGDSMGSVLSQLTLIFGILPFFGDALNFKRRELLVIGSCLIIALMQLFVIFEKGSFTRLDAFFLIVSLGFFVIISSASVAKEDFETSSAELIEYKKRYLVLLLIIFYLFGVAAGSILIINSVIKLAESVHIPEYFVSFFLVGIGTSLPELFVDIAAIRKKQYNIAIGDILGSCLVDATLSIGIGQLLFPRQISTVLANKSILYTILVAILVILVLTIRQKLDKKLGFLLILLYMTSYVLLFL